MLNWMRDSMSAIVAEAVGDDLERLYTDWLEANAEAAEMVRTLGGAPRFNDKAVAKLEMAEAKAASIVHRYWQAAAPERARGHFVGGRAN